jgi:hypothetical protein
LAQKKINLVDSYQISLTDQYPLYEKLYPAKVTGLPGGLPESTLIELYELKSIQEMFEFIPSVGHLDANLDNALETNLDSIIKTDYIQSQDKDNQLLPFIQQNHQASVENFNIQLEYPQPNSQPTDYTISTKSGNEDSYLIDIYGQIKNNQLILSFYHRYYPDINQTRFERLVGSVAIDIENLNQQKMNPALLLSDWTATDTEGLLAAYRLNVNQVFLPLPAEILNQKTYISSYMLHEKEIKVVLLEKQQTNWLDLSLFAPPDPTFCYGLQEEGYSGTTGQAQKNLLEITADNGSYCVKTAVDFIEGKEEEFLQYMEFELTLKGSLEEEKNNYQADKYDPLIKQIIKTEGQQPINAYVCIRDNETKQCANSHRFVRLSDQSQTYRLPAKRLLLNKSQSFLEIESLPFEGLKQTVSIEKVSQEFYKPVSADSINFQPKYPQEKITLTDQLVLSFPQAVSVFSYSRNWLSESFDIRLQTCIKDQTNDRDIKYFGDNFTSLIKGCSGIYYAQPFSYKSSSPYLFIYDYWLGSGQQPWIVLSGANQQIINERLSLYQGYPYIEALRQFQDKELGDNLDKIKNEFQENPKFVNASRLLEPLSTDRDYIENMNFHIFQISYNDGTMAVKAFNVIELPADWYQLKIKPSDSDTQYVLPKQNLTFKQIIPSLWQVEINKDELKSDLTGKSLLRFNQGYDEQWGIYANWGQILTGKTAGKNYKCNGFANCFEIDWQQNQDRNSFYIFYWPELLYAAGWVCTLITSTGLVLIFLIKAKRKLKK